MHWCQLLLFIFSSQGFVAWLLMWRAARPAAGTPFRLSCHWQTLTQWKFVITLNWNCFLCAQLVSGDSLSSVIAADTRLRFVQCLEALQSVSVAASPDKNFPLSPWNHLFFVNGALLFAKYQ